MRNRILFLAALLTLMACQRETTGEEPVVKTFNCFTVSVEETEMTKVHMEEGGAVKWDVCDCIGVYSDTQAPVPYYRNSNGEFRGEPVTGTKFYAFSPYDGFENDATSPLVLNNHYPFLGTIGDKVIIMPMVAHSTDNSLVFKQTCGLLHFIIKSTKRLIDVNLTGNRFEALWGSGKVNLAEENPIFQLDYGNGVPVDDSIAPSEVSRSLYVYNYDTEPVKDTTEWELFFPVPVMTFLDGISLKICFGEENSPFSITKSTAKELSISRGQMRTFTLVDLDGELEEKQKLLDLEREALIAIFNALGGPNWVNHSNWCSDKPVSEWFGITVTPDGRVESIYLQTNGLQGEIPDDIGVLTELKGLSLSTGTSRDYTNSINVITGHLPDSFGKLEKLEVLDLCQARMGGTFPECLRSLKRLKLLDLTGRMDGGVYMDHEYYHGPLPEWIGELTSLEEIRLGNNQFDGEIPESISKLTNLSLFEINANQFSGPLPDVSTLKKLVRIEYGGNYFTGGIPACYAAVLDNPGLIEFSVTYNCLSGTIAPEVWNHPAFPEFASTLLSYQRKGYKLQIDDTKVPASRWTYKTLDGGTLNLGEVYEKAPYTMIVRWAEWCMPSRGFVPAAIDIANKYEEKGLQMIWAYAGGEEADRNQFINDVGLSKWDKHIVECEEAGTYRIGLDHPLWMQGFLFRTPFVEIVNSEGNIVFIDDSEGFFDYSFSHTRSELEPFVNQLFGGSDNLYESSDYSADGRVHILQNASVGAGINVVLMGDAFSDRLIADRTYDLVMQKAVSAFFSEEPYKSLKDRFNVYYVDVVSKNEVYYGDTALNTYYGNGSRVGGNDGKVFEYAKRVLTDNQMDDALIIVMMNRDYYAGTCYMYHVPDGDYGRGVSVAYFPTSSDAQTFNGMVSHEAGGHGFAKLDDEYAYEDYGAIPADVVESHKAEWEYGWWKNTDYTWDISKVKWAKFISDERYASEGLGTYEGGGTYWTGVWRPTEDSIMRYNIGGFNAPSREAIYYRAMKLSEGPDWEYDYETFVTFDMSTRTTPTATTSAQSRPRNYVERLLPPLPPPVVVNRSWKE